MLAAATVDVKLLTGNSGYDVVVHSNQCPHQADRHRRLSEAGHEPLPNSKNLDPDTMRQLDVYEKVDGYNVPYHWGSTGYAGTSRWFANDSRISHGYGGRHFSTRKSFQSSQTAASAFWTAQRDLIPMALAYLDWIPTPSMKKSLAQAQELLLKVRPYVRYFSNDKFISDMPNKEFAWQ